MLIIEISSYTFLTKFVPFSREEAQAWMVHIRSKPLSTTEQALFDGNTFWRLKYRDE